MGRALFGRREIYTDAETITQENIVSVLRDALITHWKNRSEIEYLYHYYRGRQPILSRTKDVRPEINNKIVVNHAFEIVSFKTGYLLGEPIQYVNAKSGEDRVKQIEQLNAYMRSENKATQDQKLGEWMSIAGIGYRMVLPDRKENMDEAPFESYVLDPRQTFVVKSSGVGHKPLLNVHYVRRSDGSVIYSCYTKNQYFKIQDAKTILEVEGQTFGLPIVAYPMNEAMIGDFEVVLPILDAINSTESNRLDGVEQFIQALMLFHNVNISDEDFEKLKDLGAIKYRDVDPQTKGEIKYLTAELNQAQVQTLVENLYDTMLIICGMPNRNGGSSTSDTGSAVIMRDGWSDAEARAQRAENMFKSSETEFLKLVLKICETVRNFDLKLSDIGIQFTRRNYENIASKASVLTTLLGCDKVHPELAFSHSGMFSDPTTAYIKSKDYYEQQQKEATRLAGKTDPAEGADPGSNPGDQRDSAAGQQRGGATA